MRHSDHLFRYAWRLTRKHVDAEDLLQETMLKAYLSFGTFREGSNLKPWLCRIMLNAWLDRYRFTQRRPAELLSANITDHQVMGHSALSRGILWSAEMEALQSLPGRACLALRTLPVDLQETIYYADIQGYRNTEVAELLGIPVGTVASRLYRGRNRLRELLAEAG
ncbi:sigma-70 family RNA polymerase sigma factor [Mycolicibacterium sp.]